MKSKKKTWEWEMIMSLKNAMLLNRVTKVTIASIVITMCIVNTVSIVIIASTVITIVSKVNLLIVVNNEIL